MLKKIVGVVLMIVGIAGIFFPILPGWILIFVGLEIIGIRLVFFDKIKEYAKKKIEKKEKKDDKSSN